MEKPPINRAKVRAVLALAACAALGVYAAKNWAGLERSASHAYEARIAPLDYAERRVFDKCATTEPVNTKHFACIVEQGSRRDCGRAIELMDSVSCSAIVEAECQKHLHPCFEAVEPIRARHEWQRRVAKAFKWVNERTLTLAGVLLGLLAAIYGGDALASRLSRWFRS